MNIEYENVFCYLGFGGIKPNPDTIKLVDECTHEIQDISNPKYTYEIFDIKRQNEVLFLRGSNIIFSEDDILHYLKDSSKVALIAATLGIEIDRRILLYMKTQPIKGLILDACASAAIESLFSKADSEVKSIALAQDLYATFRYGPGYGKFPLHFQFEILQALDAYRKIGLSVTESFLLSPRKSLTAIMGLRQTMPLKDENRTKCMSCSAVNCQYRKDESLLE